MAKKLDLEAAKKRMKIGKKLLILLSVYKVYRVEFEDQDEAVEFIKKMIEWEEKEKEEY